jgi:uncharacterized protein (TIGR00255 family)
MLKSMTGYGTSHGKIGSRRIVVEAKSVNHKFCEVSLHIPSRYSALETKITDFTRSYFSRGRIDIYIRDENTSGSYDSAKIDVARLKAYHRELVRAAKLLKIPPEVKLDTLLGLPQVVVIEEIVDLEKSWRALKPLLKLAFDSQEKMRKKEGAAVGRFFEQQIKILEKETKTVVSLVPENVRHHHKQFEERIRRLTSETDFDSQRLAQEVAYFVDRTDISEELHRLKCHIGHFGDILKAAGPVGRKLDFLLQEMNREVNTLSAKSQNALISQSVVECKHVLEKMREQVQNVE